jgi:hypothetical protein
VTVMFVTDSSTLVNASGGKAYIQKKLPVTTAT